jgi:hypothetical protein
MRVRHRGVHHHDGVAAVAPIVAAVAEARDRQGAGAEKETLAASGMKEAAN